MDERRRWPVPGNCQACPSPSNISRSRPLFGNCMPGGTFRPMGQSPAIGPAAWTPPSVPGQVTGVVAAEFSILYYATAAWRRVPLARHEHAPSRTIGRTVSSPSCTQFWRRPSSSSPRWSFCFAHTTSQRMFPAMALDVTRSPIETVAIVATTFSLALARTLA